MSKFDKTIFVCYCNKSSLIPSVVICKACCCTNTPTRCIGVLVNNQGPHNVPADRELTAEEKLLCLVYGLNTEQQKVLLLQDQAKTKEMVESVLKTLSYREREVIKLRYNLGDGYAYTVEEVARIFKTTHERVREVEEKALNKLRNPTRVRRLSGFLPGGIS